ncbi:MAG TPA: DinB family protein [Thermoanaerobaculia bacterium]|nr:DinB family protein [Thermoanaerobaculia bacterium]
MDTDRSTNASLRKHLLELLRGSHAHVNFDTAVGGLPADKRGLRPEGAAHSPWEILEHLRIAQWDILEFSRDPAHVSPEWPAGYWPESQEPPDPEAWDRTAEAFRRDLQAMQDLVSDPQSDLFTPFPHGQGQTLLREALLVADHNAYHLGEMVVVRRLLGAWK